MLGDIIQSYFCFIERVSAAVHDPEFTAAKFPTSSNYFECIIIFKNHTYYKTTTSFSKPFFANEIFQIKNKRAKYIARLIILCFDFGPMVFMNANFFFDICPLNNFYHFTFFYHRHNF